VADSNSVPQPRTNGERPWFPVSAGLLEHTAAMGATMGVFLWFVHHEHKPGAGEPDGLVNQGRPVTYDEIAGDTRLSSVSVRRHVKSLETGGYIRSQHVLGGKVYLLAKPFRWNIGKPSPTPDEPINLDRFEPIDSDRSAPSNRSTLIGRTDQKCRVEPIKSNRPNKEANNTSNSNERIPSTPLTRPSGGKASPPLPDWLPLPEWEGYLEMRVAKKKPPTAVAIKLVIATLAKLRGQGHDPGAVLNQSIVNCWTDVYAIKGDYEHANRNRNGNRAEQKQQDLIDAMEGAKRIVAHRATMRACGGAG
jgi:hypothetical protein